MLEQKCFLEVYGRQKLIVQTECHLAECSRTFRLRLETSDGRLLTDGMTGRAAHRVNTNQGGCSHLSQNEKILFLLLLLEKRNSFCTVR